MPRPGGAADPGKLSVGSGGIMGSGGVVPPSAGAPPVPSAAKAVALDATRSAIGARASQRFGGRTFKTRLWEGGFLAAAPRK